MGCILNAKPEAITNKEWKKLAEGDQCVVSKTTEVNATAMGKKWLWEKGYYKKAVSYTPWFKSFSTLKRTLTANNESIVGA